MKLMSLTARWCVVNAIWKTTLNELSLKKTTKSPVPRPGGGCALSRVNGKIEARKSRMYVGFDIEDKDVSSKTFKTQIYPATFQPFLLTCYCIRLLIDHIDLLVHQSFWKPIENRKVHGSVQEASQRSKTKKWNELKRWILKTWKSGWVRKNTHSKFDLKGKTKQTSSACNSLSLYQGFPVWNLTWKRAQKHPKVVKLRRKSAWKGWYIESVVKSARATMNCKATSWRGGWTERERVGRQNAPWSSHRVQTGKNKRENS